MFASIDIGNVFVFPSRIPNMKDWSFKGLDVMVGSSLKEQRDSDITARERAFEQGTGHEGCVRLDLTSDKTSGGLDDQSGIPLNHVFMLMMHYNKLCPAVNWDQDSIASWPNTLTAMLAFGMGDITQTHA
jgi:hypothetical protein